MCVSLSLCLCVSACLSVCVSPHISVFCVCPCLCMSLCSSLYVYVCVLANLCASLSLSLSVSLYAYACCLCVRACSLAVGILSARRLTRTQLGKIGKISRRPPIEHAEWKRGNPERILSADSGSIHLGTMARVFFDGLFFFLSIFSVRYNGCRLLSVIINIPLLSIFFLFRYLKCCIPTKKKTKQKTLCMRVENQRELSTWNHAKTLGVPSSDSNDLVGIDAKPAAFVSNTLSERVGTPNTVTRRSPSILLEEGVDTNVWSLIVPVRARRFVLLARSHYLLSLSFYPYSQNAGRGLLRSRFVIGSSAVLPENTST